jgi:hypothetical protein
MGCPIALVSCMTGACAFLSGHECTGCEIGLVWGQTAMKKAKPVHPGYRSSAQASFLCSASTWE